MSRSSRIHDSARGLQSPAAVPRPHPITVHGDTRVDHFRYLNEPGHRLTRQYIGEETGYFQACMSPVSAFRDSLYDELRKRVLEDDVSVPELIDGYYYYTRVAAGCQYPVHCRISADGVGAEEVCLDENLLAADSPYCEVALAAVCPGHRRIACAVDRTGEERYEILVSDMPGGKFRLCASDAGDSLAWSRDGNCLIYTSTDDNARPDSVWVYDLQREVQTRLYEEPDAAFHVSAWGSRDNQWILIDSASNTCSETRVLSASTPFDTPILVFPRREETEYTVEPHEDRFLVLTNDQSDNFRLVETPAPPVSGETRELIAARDDVTLEYVDAYRHHLIIGERWNGREKVLIWNLANGIRRYLPGSGDELTSIDVDDLYDYEADYVRYEVSTPVKPHGIYDYDVSTAETSLRKTDEIPGYLEEAYTCERHSVMSDGVQVPLTLIYRKDPPPNQEGAAPVLLTGYGAYEEPVDTEFDSDLVSLLDRGVIVAMAHVRGGGDNGPAWHDAGRLAFKENSFSDFIACANYLVEHRYSAPGLIAAWGASAGGLLVAVAVNRCPDLFGAAVLEVPFVDVLNTLLDTDLPLTEYDFEEFGDPSDEEEYHWIRAYSPYDNVRRGVYPPMLVTAAMNDQRVGYWEALKWVARLRMEKTDDNPLLLKIDQTGHLGESGRYQAMRDTAAIYAFLLDIWGFAPDQQP